MRLHRYRPVALALLVVHLSACSSWQLTTVAPPQLIAEEEPSQVRITRTDGEQVTIRNPEVRADSIVGEDRSVAVSDVQQLEVRRFRAGATVGLVLLIGVVAVGALLMAHFIECGEKHGTSFLGPCPS